MSVRLDGANLGFDFSDSLLQTALDFFHGAALAEMTGLVEMMKIGPKFYQQLLGKAMAHDGLILYTEAPKCKITPI